MSQGTSASSPALVAPTPVWWRVALFAGVLALGNVAAWLEQDRMLSPRGQAACGMICVLGLVAACSANLRAVRWRCIAWGFALQWLLAWFVLFFNTNQLWALGIDPTAVGIPDDTRPGYELFSAIGRVVNQFVNFAMEGASFVFGILAKPPELEKRLGPGQGFVFAFAALPTIIFVSSFFTVLYYLGVLQWVVRVFARAMVYLMGTSGAETLSAAANVFMGQTEAPLIVKPFVPRMTRSEMLAMMVGGMATISGGLMATYIGMGADPVAILATSVMAAPCGLYLSKLLLPETETPETLGQVRINTEMSHRNIIDAAASGASDGLSLALNVAAMLIAFIGLVALVNYLLGLFPSGQTRETLGDYFDVRSGAHAWANWGLTLVGYLLCAGLTRRLAPDSLKSRFRFESPGGRGLAWGAGYAFFLALIVAAMLWLPEGLSLKLIFSWVFRPVAFLMGVERADVPRVADLLGTKLTLNEFVAYLNLTTQAEYQGLSPRSKALAAYALTGFANFSSIGIQIGGIGAMAPERRPDLARLGIRAPFVGYLATVLNACVAGIVM